VAAVGIAGLLAGAGIGIAANVRTRTVTAQHTTTTVAAAQAPGHETHAGTHTETHAGTRTVTRTVTQTVARTTAEPSHNVGNPGAPPTTFSGNGPKHIGTIVAPRVSAISWHASGGYLYIGNGAESGNGDLLEFSEKGRSGKTAIAPGTYLNLQVVASGEWGFTLAPER
jgi:hypothetical protein